MDVLIYHDVIGNYLLAKHKTVKTELDNIRTAIIEKSNNRLVISKNYVTFLEQLFKDSDIVGDIFTSFITELIDEMATKLLNVSVNLKSKNIDEEFKGIHSAYAGSFIVPIAEKNPSTTINFPIGILDLALPIHKNLLKLLAAYHSYTFRYNDFNTDIDILSFFNEIYSLFRKIDSVIFFDRYCNIEYHNYFNELKGKNIDIQYYTSGVALNESMIRERKEKIKGYFGKHKTTLYITKSKDKIHERKIIINKVLIIETDDDFAEIKRARLTWKVDINYSSDIVTSLLAKCDDFTRI